MNALVKKLHIYLGLLNLSIVLVFAIAGLRATLRWRPGGMPPQTALRWEEFTVPASLTGDREVAELVRTHLRIAAVEYNVRRDAEQNLVASYYTHHGPFHVTVLEEQKRLRIATHRSGMLSFFDNLHATASRDARDLRVRLWGYYNEFSIWSLSAMAVTGVYLWLSSRPRYRWAQAAFGVGSGVFALLWLLSR